MATTHPTIIRRREVEARTGLSRSGVYAKLRRNPKRPNDFDPTFPRPIQLGYRAVGWIVSEIDAWIAARTAERDWVPTSVTAPKPASSKQRKLSELKRGPTLEGEA